jgi:erythromycin esterase
MARIAADPTQDIKTIARPWNTIEDTILIGFTTYQGTVVASARWDAPMQIIEVPPACRDSWEWLLH